MGLWQSMTKALARTELPPEAMPDFYEVKQIPMSSAPFWPDSVWLATADGHHQLSRATAYTASALAYLCIRYRANKLSEPPLMVVEQTDDGEEWIEDHEYAGLLSHPNVDFSMRRMLALTSTYRDIFGAAIWLKIRDRGEATRRLYPYSPASYTVEADRDRLFGTFRITTRNGTIEVGPEDVVHFAGINPWDPAGYTSPLSVALSVLRVGEELTTAATEALTNAMMPSGVMSIPEPLGEKEFRMALAQLREQHTGPRRGGPMLVTGGATWETISMSIQEMMPDSLLSYVEATVCAIFGLHPALIGVKAGLENSPWSHLETAKTILYDEMAIPIWRADEEVITDQLLRDVDPDDSHIIRFDLAEIPALQEDESAKLDDAVKGMGFLTVNERRAKAGYAPLPGKTGETVLVPINLVPLDQVADGGTESAVPRIGRNNNGGPPMTDDEFADAVDAIGRRMTPTPRGN